MAATKKWIRDVVIALRFCPFASKADVSVLPFTSFEGCVDAMRETAKGGTRLLVLDHHMPFESFLELVDTVDELIDNDNLRGVVQLASFHPDFTFADSGLGDFTNRSPYPTLHFLNEREVSRGLREYGDSDQIWKRNIATCEKLGEEKLRSLLESCSDSSWSEDAIV